MKSFCIWAMVLMAWVATGNCRKPTSLINDPGVPLSGRWNYTAHYYSIGSPGQWHPVVIPGQWIELRGDGGFSSNVKPFSSAGSYRVMDSIHLTLIIQAGRDSLLYRYSLRGDTLELSPYPLCIEGCADRFLK
jgi:hypothetical protein